MQRKEQHHDDDQLVQGDSHAALTRVFTSANSNRCWQIVAYLLTG